jgi:anti-sigma factor RsiW
MDCKIAKTLFVEYHDGELGAGKMAALEAHLADCKLCKNEWNDYKRTVNEISGMFNLAPPLDFTSRVKQTIGRRSRGRFFSQTTSFPLGFAIVSFVLILMFMLVYLFVAADKDMEITLPPTSDQEASALDTDGKESPSQQGLPAVEGTIVP